jgi:hypothetical protein
MGRLQAITRVAVVRYLEQRANKMNMKARWDPMQDLPAAARGLDIVLALVAWRRVH